MEKRKGAAAITILLLLGLMFVALAFCVDLSRVQLTDMELQCATDMATRAGAEAISRGVGSNADLAEFEENVKAEIAMVAALNLAGGNAVAIDPDEIAFGHASEHPTKPGAYDFNLSTGGAVPGALEDTSNAINVAPSFENFPMVFGGFVGTSSVDLGAQASSIVQDRDIVVVLDRTTSMFTRDAGLFAMSEYPANLKITEDLLYGPGDRMHDGGFKGRSSEFVEVGFDYRLTRMQALKLAVSIFRDEIDLSVGREKLGLASYHKTADTPDLAEGLGQVSDGNAFDFKSSAFFSGDPTDTTDLQNASEAFKRIVGSSTALGGDGVTPQGISQGSTHEKYASALEPALSGYPNFDHTFLAMRYQGSTNIGAGIQTGVDVLFGDGRRSHAVPVLIVMTDGRQNTGPDAETVATTQVAAHPNMRIYTVTFGNPANIDTDRMQAIATTGRGQHYHANNVQELVSAFRDLARSAGVALIE